MNHLNDQNEESRLNVLHECKVLDTPRVEEFDDIVRLALHICGVPIAAISLIDQHRQWFKSIVGLDAEETPRSIAFCAHTIQQNDVMVVPDARTDARFSENPLVTGDPNIRFYAGAPLITTDGYALGSLCVIDKYPRELTQSQIDALRILARQVTYQLESARRASERELWESALIETEKRLFLLSEAAFEGIAVAQDGVVIEANSAYAEMFGYNEASEVIGLGPDQLCAPQYRSIVRKKVADGDESPYEALLLRQDGSTFLAEIRGRATQVNGRAARVAAVRDITERKAMEETLRQSEQRLAEAQHVGGIGSWEYDNRTGQRLWSAELFRLFGFDPLLGVPPLDDLIRRFHPQDRDRFATAYSLVRSEGVPFELDLRVLVDDDTVRWLHGSCKPVFDDAGGVTRVVGNAMDVTERVLSEQRFRILFEESSNAHIILDGHSLIDCNNAAVQILRCADKADLIGRHPAELSPEYQPDGRRSSEKAVEMDAIAKELGYHRFEWTHQKIDGEEFPVEVTLNTVTLNDKQVLLAVLHDLTERKIVEQKIKDYSVGLEFQISQSEAANALLEEANSRLSELATTDGLTGLKNHLAFQQRLSEEIERSQRYQSPLSVIMLDVDHFKSYNDLFGHPEGDKILRQVAILLSEGARSIDIVARYGGEEFAVILPQTDESGALVIAERLRCEIAQFSWQKRPITASFGVATFGMDTGDLVSSADRALYRSKAAGRNRVSTDVSPPALIG